MGALGQCQWGDCELVFPLDMQYSATGHQDFQMWAGSEQVSKLWSLHHHLLEAVQHQQEVLIAQECFQVLRVFLAQVWSQLLVFQAERVGDGMHDECGIADGGQWYEPDPIGEAVEQLGRDLQAQACFADASHAGESHKTDVRMLKQSTYRHYLLLAPNE